MSQPSDAQQDLDVGLRIVHAFLAVRGYKVMAEFRSGNYPVTFHLAQDGRRCTLVVQRATLLRPDLEDILAAPTLTDRLSREAVVVLEGVEPR